MDLNYSFEKLHNGTTSVKITQQDKAALAKLHVPRLREYFGELKNKLAGKGTKLNGHESAIAQAEQHLQRRSNGCDAIAVRTTRYRGWLGLTLEVPVEAHAPTRYCGWF